VASLFPGDRICAVVAAPTAREAQRQVRRALNRRGPAGTVELRLDYLRSASERSALLRWLSGRHQRWPVFIATCRSRRGGGRFRGSLHAELRILAQAVAAGCRWCDVEIETAERLAPSALRKALAPARLLISAHDFRGLPRGLGQLVRRLERRGAGAVKVAGTCRTLKEVRRLLSLAHGRRDLVAVPMGDTGDAARILALREGSALAYAATAQAIAPGQLSLEAMRRVHRLGGPSRRFGASGSGPTRDTRVYGVIGDPIAHSLSPLMHNAAFAARGLDAVYLPFRVRELRDFMEAVRGFGISGFSVTLPHKQRILEYLDGCDSLAAEIGAVNTVRAQGGNRLYGYNTDYAGVLHAIERRVPLASSRVLLLGAGGSARAVAFALAKAGAAVVIWARRQGRARALARAVGGQAIARAALRREKFDAIVNCTPVGMYPGGGSPLDAAELNARVVMDLIYRPRKTELLKRAERRGIAVISGVEMFLAQGAAQWEIWTGRRAPQDVMRRAVLAALAAEEKTVARR
jgi:3-dehydroquinate dehydratase/shikimate dehydrogenase